MSHKVVFPPGSRSAANLKPRTEREFKLPPNLIISNPPSTSIGPLVSNVPPNTVVEPPATENTTTVSHTQSSFACAPLVSSKPVVTVASPVSSMPFVATQVVSVVPAGTPVDAPVIPNANGSDFVNADGFYSGADASKKPPSSPTRVSVLAAGTNRTSPGTNTGIAIANSSTDNSDMLLQRSSTESLSHQSSLRGLSVMTDSMGSSQSKGHFSPPVSACNSFDAQRLLDEDDILLPEQLTPCSSLSTSPPTFPFLNAEVASPDRDEDTIEVDTTPSFAAPAPVAKAALQENAPPLAIHAPTGFGLCTAHRNMSSPNLSSLPQAQASRMAPVHCTAQPPVPFLERSITTPFLQGHSSGPSGPTTRIPRSVSNPGFQMPPPPIAPATPHINAQPSYNPHTAARSRPSSSASSTSSNSSIAKPNLTINTGQLTSPDKAAISNDTASKSIPRPNLHPPPGFIYHTKSTTGRRIPPPVDCPYSVVDNGNCSPRYMRSSMCAPPSTATLLQHMVVPMGVVVTPFAPPVGTEEMEIPLVAFDGGKCPPRCTRCFGYINSGVTFSDNGSLWQCNMCQKDNEVEEWYLSSLDGRGDRLDLDARPELKYGSVDYLVSNTDDYPGFPQTQVYIFAIDISPHAVESGFTAAAILAVTACLQLLPRDSDENTSTAVRVGIMTFHSSLQFYSFRQMDMDVGGANKPMRKKFNQKISPTMRSRYDSNVNSNISVTETATNTTANYLLPVISIHVCEIDDPFPPIPADQWLLPLAEYSLHFETLLHHISASFTTSLAPTGEQLHSAPMAAVKVCHMALKEDLVSLATHNSSAPRPPQRYSKTSIPRTPSMFDLWPSTSTATTVPPDTPPFTTPPLQSQQQKKGPSRGAKVYCLTASAPSPSCGFGAVNTRENISQYGKVEEFGMYGRLAHTSKLAAEEETKKVMVTYDGWIEQLVTDAVSVDVLLAVGDGREYRETAIVGELCSRTGGSLVMMGGEMKRVRNVQRVEEQLVHLVNATRGRDVYMQLKCSIGYCVDQYTGGGQFDATAQVVTLPQASTGTTCAFILKCDVDLPDEEKVHIQLTTLCVNSSNQHIVRVHNLTLFATDAPNVVYRHIDTEALVVTMWKVALQLALNCPLASVAPKKGAVEYIRHVLSSAMHSYRIQCSKHTSSSQLVMPESLRLLPLFTLGMLKHPALLNNMTPNKIVRTLVRADERAFYLNHALSLNVKESMLALHPKMYPLHQLSGTEGGCVVDFAGTASTQFPECLYTSSIVFQRDGVYLLVDHGISWLYIGRDVPAASLTNWFGIGPSQDDVIDRPQFDLNFQMNCSVSNRMVCILNAVQEFQSLKPELKIVWGDKVAGVDCVRFSVRLLEDSIFGEQSYVEYLCAMHLDMQKLAK